MADSSLSQQVSRFSSPARAAVATLIASRAVGEIVKAGEGADMAREALTTLKSWVAGGKIPGRRISNLVYDENDRGVEVYNMKFRDAPIGEAWNTLVTALMYVAWLAYQKDKASMPEDVAEVRDDTIDQLLSDWQSAASFDSQYLDKAVGLLDRSHRTADAIDIDALERELAR